MSLSFKMVKSDLSGRTQVTFTQECESETEKPLVIRATLEGVYINNCLLSNPYDFNEFARTFGKAGEQHLALKKAIKSKLMGKP